MELQEGDAFLDKALIRLVGAGYDVDRQVSYDGADFDAVGKRSQFMITKFGYSEEFFVFDELNAVDWRRLEAFCEQALAYAVENKRVKLPRGLGSAVTCFAVAMTEGLDPEVATAVRERATRSHWAAIPMLVVHDRTDGSLHYLERTPAWGAAYYRGLRKRVLEALG